MCDCAYCHYFYLHISYCNTNTIETLKLETIMLSNLTLAWQLCLQHSSRNMTISIHSEPRTSLVSIWFIFFLEKLLVIGQVVRAHQWRLENEPADWDNVQWEVLSWNSRTLKLPETELEKSQAFQCDSLGLYSNMPQILCGFPPPPPCSK